MTQWDATSVSLVIAAFGAMAVSVIASIATAIKSSRIEKHVNSAATAQTTKIEALETRVASLLKELSAADLKQIAALLAQSLAARVGVNEPASPTKVEVVNPETRPVPTVATAAGVVG